MVPAVSSVSPGRVETEEDLVAGCGELNGNKLSLPVCEDVCVWYVLYALTFGIQDCLHLRDSDLSTLVGTSIVR
jgi:hypothetical protein